MPGSGNTTVNFGAYPGQTSGTTDVTGQTGFVSTSQVEAWIQPAATGEHSADDHRVEEIEVYATYVVDGTLRITGEWKPGGDRIGIGMPYGNFNVGWVWV